MINGLAAGMLISWGVSGACKHPDSHAVTMINSLTVPVLIRLGVHHVRGVGRHAS